MSENGDYWEGFEEGYSAAVKVFSDQFFGGPTKDMVLGWFSEFKLDPTPLNASKGGNND